jgi:hypothetical protein
MCDLVAFILMVFADYYIADAGANQPPDYVVLGQMRNRSI